MKRLPAIEDAINRNQAAEIAGVTREAIDNWIYDNVLDSIEYAEYKILSRKQLLRMLSVRKQDLRKWKATWKQLKRKEETE